MLYPKPPKRKRNKAYLAFISQLPCIRCGKPGPSEPHHVRLGHNGGMGRKPDDSRALPLCHECHIHNLHQHGEGEFWAKGEREGWNEQGIEALISAYNCTYQHMTGRKP